jgi:diguanylate cyclase (GGDEF)-like protein
LGRFLDESVDGAAMDGSKTLAQRLIASVLAALVLPASLSAQVILPWLLVLVMSEVLTWRATRSISAATPGSAGQRAIFVGHVALSTSLWSLVCVWLWFDGQAGLKVVGAIIICTQLIHAQTHTYRSRLVYALSAGIPACVISVLALGFAGLAGFDLVTAVAGLGLTFAYVEAGTRANIASAARIAAAQLELERLAYTDALTALSNRRRFTERLKDLIAYSQKHRTPFALVLVDLDGFKAVNDAFGHDIGDNVLIAVAESLRQVARSTDHVARLGGDEFAMLVSDVGSSSFAAGMFRSIAEAVSANQIVTGHRLQTTLSVGAALYPGDGQEADELLKAADIALYAAKSAGRNTWRTYRPADRIFDTQP